jgi:DNA-binding NarL/FixJ family response regulator
MAVPIRVVIADDHPVVRDGLRRIFSVEHDISVIGETSNGEDAMRMAAELRPDVLLLDLMMPGVSGLEAIQKVHGEKQELPARILVLTADTDRHHLVQAVRLEVHGIISKDAGVDKLLKAIRTVAAGHYWIERELLAEAIRKREDRRSANFGLSPREIEIIRAVAAGASNKELAGKFAISELTIKRHLTNIYQKVRVTSRLELALFAIENELSSSAHHSGLSPGKP